MTNETPEDGARLRRRLTLADSAILIAAIALGLIGAVKWKEAPNSGLWSYAQRAWVVLTPLTLSMLVLRRMGPRPALAAGQMGPGDAACLGFLVSTILILGARVPGMVAYGMNRGDFPPHLLQTLLDDRRAAVGVLTAWVVLRLTRGLAPAQDWVDRAGTVLGGCWIALTLVVPFANTLLQKV